MYSMWAWCLWKSEQAIRSPGTLVTNVCESACEFWEGNPGLLQDPQGLLITKPEQFALSWDRVSVCILGWSVIHNFSASDISSAVGTCICCCTCFTLRTEEEEESFSNINCKTSLKKKINVLLLIPMVLWYLYFDLNFCLLYLTKRHSVCIGERVTKGLLETLPWVLQVDFQNIVKTWDLKVGAINVALQNTPGGSANLYSHYENQRGISLERQE